MSTAHVRVYCGLAVLAALSTLWLTQPVQGDEAEAELKRRALALNNVTGEDTIKAEIRTLAKDPAAAKDLLKVAVRLAKGKDQPFTYNGAFILARAAHELRDLDSGRVFYRLCIEQSMKLVSGEKMARSYTGFISLLIQKGRFDECAKICEEFLSLPEEGRLMEPVRKRKSEVLMRMVQALARDGQIDKATKLVDNLLEAQPENWAALELRGFVLRESGKYEDSVRTYESIIDRVKRNEEMSKDGKAGLLEHFRYTLSSVYVDMNRVDKAADLLKDLLKEKPDDPTYNNDLGYIWADANQNLDEAERLIRKALDEDKKQRRTERDFREEDDRDNAAYLDSLGWVLYRKKNFAEAKKYLLKAVADPDGQHIEILDHLGDVHLALGEKVEAIAAWKQAVGLEPSSRRELLRRIDVQKKLRGHQPE